MLNKKKFPGKKGEEQKGKKNVKGRKKNNSKKRIYADNYASVNDRTKGRRS